MGRRLALGGLGALALALAAAATATATPSAPTLLEPVPGAVIHPADVHMEAGGYGDEEGDPHDCSDWEIRETATDVLVWRALCITDGAKVHAHLGDGQFVGPLEGDAELGSGRSYVVRARFRDTSGEWGEWTEREFTTGTAGGVGADSDQPWRALQPGFRVDVVAGGLRLPVSLATVPEPQRGADAPILYIGELYGTIKVLTRGGEVRTYAHDLLNFDPSGLLPGDGVRGIGGIAVDPGSGDLFASLVYRAWDAPDPKPYYAKVIRLESTEDGLVSLGETTILDLPEPEGQSHQVSNLTFGPDQALYLHVGDGILDPSTARSLDSWLGKVLRFSRDGAPLPGNPFYDGAPFGPRDYVFALGFRNPFGGAWRASNGAHYAVENGPTVDRLARVEAGVDYGWDGTDASMYTAGLFHWHPQTAPVGIDFIQPGRGSGFPPTKRDHAFVTLSGATWATGPQARTKRIVEFAPGRDGELAGPPRDFVEYTGIGKATAAGVSVAPGGLYFTDLFKDTDYSGPADSGAQLLRVSYVGPPRCGDPIAQIGTPVPDLLTGTAGPDRIVGGPGRDRLRGLAGGDCIWGNGGGDLTVGGRGRDRLSGGPGRDRLVGGRGTDLIRCGAGFDTVVGPAPEDRLIGCERRVGGGG